MAAPLLALVSAAGVQAQPAQSTTPQAWIVLAEASDEPAAVERVGRAVQQVIAALENAAVPVWSVEQTREQFRTTHSREPTPITPTELDKLPALVRAALDNYAFDQRPLALRQVRKIVDTANRAMESLLRDTRIAQQFLDACLLLVRSDLDRGDHGNALRYAMNCRGLALNVAPSKRRHPPQVLDLLLEAEAQMRADATWWLRVTSEPSNCTVFINGRALGTTPYEVQPPPGERRVQVECNPVTGTHPGRVHTVRVEQDDVALHIDTAFDGAVRTLDGEPLRIETQAGSRGTEALRYAAQVAETLGVAHVLLVSSSAPESVVIRAIDARGSSSAEVGFEPVGGTGEDLTPALYALIRGRNWLRDPALPNDCAGLVRTILEGQSRDDAKLLVGRCIAAGRPDADHVTYPPSVTELYDEVYAELALSSEREAATRARVRLDASPVARSSRTDAAPDPRRSWLPPAGVVVGTSLLAAGWITYGVSSRRTGRTGGLVTGVAGGALLLPSFAAWTFPDTKDGVPWWSWVAGAVGAGGVAIGIYEASLAGACAGRAAYGCAEYYVDADLYGAFTIASSAPLVLLPVAHALFNHDGPDGAELSFSASPSRLLLTGRF